MKSILLYLILSVVESDLSEPSPACPPPPPIQIKVVVCIIWCVEFYRYAWISLTSSFSCEFDYDFGRQRESVASQVVTLGILLDINYPPSFPSSSTLCTPYHILCASHRKRWNDTKMPLFTSDYVVLIICLNQVVRFLITV